MAREYYDENGQYVYEPRPDIYGSNDSGMLPHDPKPGVDWDPEWDPFVGWRWAEGVTPSQAAPQGQVWQWRGFAPDNSRLKTNDYGWQFAIDPKIIGAAQQVNPPTTQTNPPNPPPPTTPNPYVALEGGTEGDFDPATFQWTPFTPDPYAGYAEFEANPFIDPNPTDVMNDPWLDFALKKGTQQLENSAAYNGMVRSGMNKQNVLEHGVNFTRQFGNDVWNRAMQGWRANEDNRFRAWTGNKDLSLDTYNTNYRGQSDRFNATRRAEEMDFNARLQQWRDRLDATTRVATAGLGS